MFGGLFRGSTSGTVAVGPFLTDLHHAAHRTVSGGVFAKPSLDSMGLFRQSLFGGFPVDVIPGGIRYVVFLLPIGFQGVYVGQFVHFFFVKV